MTALILRSIMILRPQLTATTPMTLGSRGCLFGHKTQRPRAPPDLVRVHTPRTQPGPVRLELSTLDSVVRTRRAARDQAAARARVRGVANSHQPTP